MIKYDNSELTSDCVHARIVTALDGGLELTMVFPDEGKTTHRPLVEHENYEPEGTEERIARVARMEMEILERVGVPVPPEVLAYAMYDPTARV